MAGGEPSHSNVDSINGLDGGNLLHMNPNDSTSTYLIPFRLTGPENYRIWASAMKLALQARNKYAFMDGFYVKSAYSTSNVLSTQWDRCNDVVLTWIMNFVSADVYMGLVYSVDDATVWKDLKSTYDKVDGSIIFNLLHKFSCLKQGGSSLAEYYHKLNSLWREFDALTKPPTCVYDANKELETHNKLMKLMQFFMRLDECYLSVRSSLLTRNPIPEVKDAYVIVSMESHRGILESSRNCGMIGHTIERCYELIGYPPGFKKVTNLINQTSFKQNFNANSDVKTNDKQYSVNSQNSSSSFTPEQMKKLLSLINDTSSGSIHVNMTGRASFFNGNVWFNINFSKYLCGNNSLYVKTITMEWIIDYGTNKHLTISTVGMSNVVDISNLKITVEYPNGTLATVSHVGNLQLTKNMMIFYVLVIHGYFVSLLSVNKMIKDSKLFVGFDEEKIYIHDLKREIILGTGSETGGLYLLDLQSSKNIGNVNLVHSFHVSKTLWHSRLDHPADQVLVVLKNDLNLSKSTDVSACETCLRAKQTRDPFPFSDHKSEKLGDLIHLEFDKFTSRSDKCVLLGYFTVKKAYKLFSLDNRNVIFSRDVKFFETVFPFKMRNTYVNDRADTDYVSEADHLTFFDKQLSQSPYDEGKATSVEEGSPAFSRIDTEATQLLENGTATQIEDTSLSEGNVFEPNIDLSSIPTYSLTSESIDIVQYEPKRSSRVSKLPAKLNDYVIDSKLKYGIEKHTIVGLPKGRKAIGNKWIYKIKYKASGEVERYKAKVVAKGFNQKEGFDYDETFSPVVMMVTVRCLIVVAVSNSLPLYQLDINNAFLYGDLVEDVYMTLPLGFGNDNGNKVCMLNKSLYGLKQVPRQWNAKLTAALIEHGFV
uniref:Ribonuclease H-like domain-containing protein n=1 Tax=Tanacetum cinerariifolium TaxID=118510 RepID=A0A6L2N1D1_TANCI|nr:ribonuclease H-like domain-containing protein [Tanacetum cinerariifolium]